MKETVLFNSIKLDQLVKYLLLLLILTFPFGSHLIAIKVAGLFTLNPFMVVSLILALLAFIYFRQIQKKLDWALVLLLAFWLSIGILQIFLVPGKEDALIDIRSLGMMFLVSLGVIWSKEVLGFQLWRRTILKGLQALFVMLLIFAIFELMTGIHFTGEYTEKIDGAPPSEETYSPIFLFDNPNNMVAHFLLLGGLLILFDLKSKKNVFFTFFVLAVCFLISLVSLSRIGEITALLVISLFVLIYLYDWTKSLRENKDSKFTLITVGFTLVFFLIVYVKNEKYYGPIWQNEIADKQSEMLEKKFKKKNNQFDDCCYGDFGAIKYDILNYVEKDSLDSLFNSTQIRKGLILNGVDFFKESVIIGIGPGQYRYRHKTHDIEYYTKTNISPHFWLIELLSQFGLLIFVPYIVLLIWIVVRAISMIKRELFTAASILICMIIFGLSSLLPSSFLILEINWIFIALIVGFTSSFEDFRIKESES